MPSTTLSADAISSILSSAARAKVEATVAFLDAGVWLTFRGCLTGLDRSTMTLEPIEGCYRKPVRPLADGDPVQVTFRMGPYKYTFDTAASDVRMTTMPGGAAAFFAHLAIPKTVQRTDRRAVVRTAVPASCGAKASFWLGGRAMEPDAQHPDRPVWTGTLVDLSVQGFAVRIPRGSAGMLEVGDLVGARLVWGNPSVSICTDAQLRHTVPEQTACVLGFQFIGMDSTPEGRAALAAVDEFIRTFPTADT